MFVDWYCSDDYDWISAESHELVGDHKGEKISFNFKNVEVIRRKMQYHHILLDTPNAGRMYVSGT
jgi:hypothetical protein